VQLPTNSLAVGVETFVRVIANGGQRGVGSLAIRLEFDPTVVEVGALTIDSPHWSITDAREGNTVVVVANRNAAAADDAGSVFRLRVTSFSRSSGPPLGD